jgi:ATP synthase I chain
MLTEIADRRTLTCAEATRDVALERRVVVSMCASVVVAVATSAALAPWRVTTGLLLGGALSLFNHHWLKGSITSGLRPSGSGEARPAFGVSRFVLRYLVVAFVIAAASALNVASLVAALAGMCSFVVAIFVEAGYQLYASMIKREES